MYNITTTNKHFLSTSKFWFYNSFACFHLWHQVEVITVRKEFKQFWRLIKKVKEEIKALSLQW
jgi:hypothetical protein